ncbi:hypothetical protein [Cryobacterium sp. HLT2-28]|uniref:hypothetical protein n=1 Tax=Cryobacterium sp. HLT2-28 TaxID=1259146 RepID=UPI00141B9446|nr:hypothetical protein [Cryobacterium sp. HLT2-28]
MSEERVITVVVQREEVRPVREPIPSGEQEQVDVARHAAASGFRDGLPEKVL